MDKKAKPVLHDFIDIINKSKLKPNKLWADQGRYFYNKFMQIWLYNANILMCLTYNDCKWLVRGL